MAYIKVPGQYPYVMHELLLVCIVSQWLTFALYYHKICYNQCLLKGFQSNVVSI